MRNVHSSRIYVGFAYEWIAINRQLWCIYAKAVLWSARDIFLMLKQKGEISERFPASFIPFMSNVYAVFSLSGELWCLTARQSHPLDRHKSQSRRGNKINKPERTVNRSNADFPCSKWTSLWCHLAVVLIIESINKLPFEFNRHLYVRFDKENYSLLSST